jgi:tetratricopeptide (TPR) repeat protein
MNKSCGRPLGLLVGCTAVLALLLTGCSGMLSEVSEKFEKGRQAQISNHDGLKLYSAKDYARAIPHFQRALALQPDFDDAEAYLAWSYYYIGKYPEATRHFRQAISRQPRWEGLHNGLGWSRYRVGRYHLAIESFQQAVDLDPRFRDAAVGLGYSLFELGRYAEALPRLERLTREGEGHALQSPTPDVEAVRSRYTWGLYYVGEYGKARDEFAKGIAARPSWYGLHNGLGWTYLKLGDRVKARASFQRALQLKSDLADAREGLAQARR